MERRRCEITSGTFGKDNRMRIENNSHQTQGDSGNIKSEDPLGSAYEASFCETKTNARVTPKLAPLLSLFLSTRNGGDN